METVARHALIYQHPSAPVNYDHERTAQPVEPVSLDSIVRTQTATITELQRVVHELARTPEPVFVRALRGEVPEDTCSGCGQPTVDHYGGCAYAIRQNKPMQTTYPLGLLYGDPYLEVTRAVTVALEEACGPAIAVMFETLGNDERLMVARQLSRVAVEAFKAAGK